MHQTYEGLDRPGGFSRVRLLSPLAHRDYRLLLGGMSVSLLGDGLFLVAGGLLDADPGARSDLALADFQLFTDYRDDERRLAGGRLGRGADVFEREGHVITSVRTSGES